MTSKVSLDKNKIKFVLLEGVHQSTLDTLHAAGYTNIDYYKKALDGDELKEAIKDAHFIGLRSRTHLTEEMIAAAPKLIAIGCFCIGTNQVDLNAAKVRGIPVFFHTPSEVKAAVTGSGRADKASVGRMVTKILGLEKIPKPADAADALAIAICHGWRGGGIGSGINMSANTQTHQGSRPVRAQHAKLTPAQRIWLEAEAKTRR